MTLALLLKYWKEGVIVLLLLTVFGFCAAWEHGLEAKGAAKERGRAADSVIKTVTVERLRVDTVYRRDTIRLTKRLATFDTIRDTVLKHLTDTLIVKQFIAAADSFKLACTDAFSDCNRRYGLLAIERDQWKSKAQSSTVAESRSCVAPSVITGVVAAGLGFLAHTHR